jgi:hypothetical protein
MLSVSSTPEPKRFKYQSQIDEFKGKCDLAHYKEHEARKSFRWVYDTITDPRNFLPVYQRFSDRPRSSCAGWALSMFETQDQAKRRLEKLTKDKPKAYLKLGTHTAVGVLKRADGQSEPATEGTGHFNHFEYENRNLETEFSIVECVVIV